jgi:hypothetical protein
MEVDMLKMVEKYLMMIWMMIMWPKPKVQPGVTRKRIYPKEEFLAKKIT